VHILSYLRRGRREAAGREGRGSGWLRGARRRGEAAGTLTREIRNSEKRTVIGKSKPRRRAGGREGERVSGRGGAGEWLAPGDGGGGVQMRAFTLGHIHESSLTSRANDHETVAGGRQRERGNARIPYCHARLAARFR